TERVREARTAFESFLALQCDLQRAFRDDGAASGTGLQSTDPVCRAELRRAHVLRLGSQHRAW
ncbi:MAG: hypothetical protein WBF53_16715, partial [Litorimonas sp.]